MRFDPIDPRDAVAFERWFATRSALDRFDFPDEPGWAAHELRAIALDESDNLAEIELALEGDVPVGTLWIVYPIRENVDAAVIRLAVVPEHRRRGLGTQLEAHAIELVGRRGRTTAVGTTAAPVGTGDGFEVFARGLGYSAALPEHSRALTLPIDEARLAPLYEDAIAHSSDYEVVQWVGPCPPQLVPGRCALAECMSTDAPHGELGKEPEQWDAERLAAFEATKEKMERDTYSTGAVERVSGGLVAFSELSVPRAVPSTAYQWDTVVLPAHRGNRLGMLVKIVNLRTMIERSPSTTRVVTSNAAENAPMIRVNEALGFELIATEIQWKRSIA